MVMPKAKIGHSYGRREASKVSILNAVLCSAGQRCAAPFQGWRVNIPPAAAGSARRPPANIALPHRVTFVGCGTDGD